MSVIFCASANIHSDKFLALVNYLYGDWLETPTLNRMYTKKSNLFFNKNLQQNATKLVQYLYMTFALTFISIILVISMHVVCKQIKLFLNNMTYIFFLGGRVDSIHLNTNTFCSATYAFFSWMCNVYICTYVDFY